MDIYAEETVATWLVADGRTLIAPQYPLGVGNDPKARKPVRCPDVLAVRPSDRKILICEVKWSKVWNWSEHRKKIADYRNHLDNIRAGLDHWLGLGIDDGRREWKISIWYFVPGKYVGEFRSNVMEHETIKTDGGMEVSAVPLEETVPRKYTWGGRENYVPENG